MVESDEIVKKETILDKCKKRDEQAKILLEIIELSKKLDFCTTDLAKEIKYPQFIKDETIEMLRQKLDWHFWHQCFEECQIEKFLTTTDKEKLYENLEKDTPVFNYENAMRTIFGFINSKDATATNMIKKIYEEVTDLLFSVGNKNNNSEKRIQKGIPKMFRASMFYVYGKELPGYVSSSNSNFNLIDDLERACYLVDGKLQPDRQVNITSLTDSVLRKGELIIESTYFNMQIFLNGNVKITFNKLDVLKRLNYWGLTGNRLA